MTRLGTWLAPPRPEVPAVVTDPAVRRVMGIEVVLVLAVTLGTAGFRSLLSLLNALLQPEPLSSQTAALNVSRTELGLIDLAYQLSGVVQLVAWAGLGVYLLWRSGVGGRMIGLDRTRPVRDVGYGLGLAALVGVPGLAFYLAARAAGLNLTVVPAALTDTWWRFGVLLLAAVANAVAEEVLVVGFLVTRLRQLGWSENGAVFGSALLRGSYHLYQGFGGFVGNFAMGLLFGRFWQRTNRLWALVAAHALIDVVAFVGYTLLRGHVSWLP
ncbi:MAG TPA: type II CAAX endopeptidase family protein [Cryptosporangiaceae bacterium]|nr:type II CAAX endopeptidase family protein [Cryptosporangiaceae bacterium]